ncbi:MAG TPA: helicase HerA-like domain-containing protein [Frateuria sp.]|uniref:helicase HerA-like domain-containing protein n=1 Tax=Frateuria sp. TaxID=2211372 RepID=UPI002DF15619|nr:helicase HerA-like domain-containing protein [Frateuria sp.]
MSDSPIGRDGDTDACLEARYTNRRGRVATDTGRPVSLMLPVEGFSRQGMPCMMADVKGDLACLALPASEPGDKLKARPSKLRLADWQPQANPAIYPDDMPEEILHLLGNRIRHAWRGCTSRDQNAVRAAAETFAA